MIVMKFSTNEPTIEARFGEAITINSSPQHAYITQLYIYISIFLAFNKNILRGVYTRAS